MQKLIESWTFESVRRFLGWESTRRAAYWAAWVEDRPDSSRNPFRDTPGATGPQWLNRSDSPLRLGTPEDRIGE